MTDPTPEPSPDAEGQNAPRTPDPAPGDAPSADVPAADVPTGDLPAGDVPPSGIPPAPDPQEILKAISGINLDTIDADIESAFGSRMAQLDEMLAGLDSLVEKIEKDIQNLDQPKPDGPQ